MVPSIAMKPLHQSGKSGSLAGGYGYKFSSPGLTGSRGILHTKHTEYNKLPTALNTKTTRSSTSALFILPLPPLHRLWPDSTSPKPPLLPAGSWGGVLLGRPRIPSLKNNTTQYHSQSLTP